MKLFVKMSFGGFKNVFFKEFREKCDFYEMNQNLNI